MQSAVVRSLPRSVRASAISRTTARRTFASEAPGDVTKKDTTRSVPPNSSGGSSRLPFIIAGAVLLAIIPGRYILASDKPAASGVMDRKALRAEADPSKEHRDPRDSGVKTLEQKRQKEQGS